MITRRQASLYLYDVPVVEDLRRRFNPAQAALIPSHITLCREDEVSDWIAFENQVRSRLSIAVALEFGAPVRDRDLVYLPAVGSTQTFDQLRRDLLELDGTPPRRQLPHITIIHPRNGSCTDEIYDQIVFSIAPFTAIFHEISLIEQHDGGAWNCLASFRDPLAGRKNSKCDV